MNNLETIEIKDDYDIDVIQSSLNNVRISGRRSGNTTRIIDNAIQMLFNGKTVIIKDYPDVGKLERGEMLLKKIKKRLRIEHGIDDQNLKINTTITKSLDNDSKFYYVAELIQR